MHPGESSASSFKCEPKFVCFDCTGSHRDSHAWEFGGARRVLSCNVKAP